MSSLPPHLRRRAMSGDLLALRLLEDRCTQGLPYTISANSILDIVLHNLRPALHIHTPNLLENEEHRKWLCRVIICFSVLAQGLGMFDDSEGSAVNFPEIIAGKLRVHWGSHILPCLSVLMEYYLLDDMQASLLIVDETECPKHCSFEIACDLMETIDNFKPGMLISIFSADEKLRQLTISLLVEYFSVYVYERRIEVSVIGFEALVEGHNHDEIFQYLRDHPQFSPSFTQLFRYYSKSTGYTDGDLRAFKTALYLVGRLGQSYPQLLDTTFQKCPELPRCYMKTWNRLLTQRYYHRQKPREKCAPITEKIRKECFSTVMIISLSMVTHGGCSFIRKLVQNRFCQNLALMCVLWPGEEDNTIQELLKVVLEGLRPFLIHFSVLEPAVRARHSMLEDPFKYNISPATATLWRKKLYQHWESFLDYLEDRERVFDEYNEYVIGQQNPLCSNAQCLNGVPGRSMKCGHCHYAMYCSRRCQRVAWPAHKQQCYLHNTHGSSLLNIRDRDFLHFEMNFDLAQVILELDDELAEETDALATSAYTTMFGFDYQNAIAAGMQVPRISFATQDLLSPEQRAEVTAGHVVKEVGPNPAIIFAAEIRNAAAPTCPEELTRKVYWSVDDKSKMVEILERGERKNGERWFPDGARRGDV